MLPALISFIIGSWFIYLKDLYLFLVLGFELLMYIRAVKNWMEGSGLDPAFRLSLTWVQKKGQSDAEEGREADEIIWPDGFFRLIDSWIGSFFDRIDSFTGLILSPNRAIDRINFWFGSSTGSIPRPDQWYFRGQKLEKKTLRLFSEHRTKEETSHGFK